jgi:DNA-binding transcriptional regulator YiaG
VECYKCKAGRLTPDEVVSTIEVAGYEFSGTVAARRCGACGERLLDGSSLERLQLRAAATLAAAGEASPGALRFMRKAAGLRGADLAALLDVAGETVRGWETGALPVERRAAALLGAIVAEAAAGSAATLERLRALAAPARLPKRVKLDTKAA